MPRGEAEAEVGEILLGGGLRGCSDEGTNGFRFVLIGGQEREKAEREVVAGAGKTGRALEAAEEVDGMAEASEPERVSPDRDGFEAGLVPEREASGGSFASGGVEPLDPGKLEGRGVELWGEVALAVVAVQAVEDALEGFGAEGAGVEWPAHAPGAGGGNRESGHRAGRLVAWQAGESAFEEAAGGRVVGQDGRVIVGEFIVAALFLKHVVSLPEAEERDVLAGFAAELSEVAEAGGLVVDPGVVTGAFGQADDVVGIGGSGGDDRVVAGGITE